MSFNVAEVTSTFFDRSAVTKQVDAGLKRMLAKFGAFVRQRARTSIRTRKAPSRPGQPPSSHVGTLKRLIYFGYDTAARSVVIGPVLGGPASGAPRRLEEGGVGNLKRLTGNRPAHYAARPYMLPSFQAELPAAVAGLKGLIR